jgi:hypothetical protein
VEELGLGHIGAAEAHVLLLAPQLVDERLDAVELGLADDRVDRRALGHAGHARAQECEDRRKVLAVAVDEERARVVPHGAELARQDRREVIVDGRTMPRQVEPHQRAPEHSMHSPVRAVKMAEELL